ncbi:PREDICTED: cathepsin L1-like [Amphimedon queenslandica]|uniref:Uncharacterized protein n=1 Tax=Amphimedon queenslandica TaxID=400682 RepID=A0A1X7V2X8_AMPQE|nr:PREDICTED: cathepsin L1-like [Amphimedon queenslandica]|eukprot:XP_003385986.1 PREDICTED: cathepsin L1-like [Amphimedon queenslandica]
MMLYLLAVIGLLYGGAHSLTDEEWEQWKITHRKTYQNVAVEESRRQVWSSNYKLIQEHNMKESSFKLALNHFADLTNDEYTEKYLSSFDLEGFKRNMMNESLHANNAKADTAVDWRDRGAVTSVKNQGQCGSCWAFSATGALEAMHFLNKGTLVSLSEQQLVDCSYRYGNAGCQGGLMDRAFAYVRNKGYICSEESYPYVGYMWACKSSSCSPAASCRGYKNIASGDEESLTNAVSSVGTVSVAIDASRYSFQFYSSGVFYDSDCSSSRLNHGVLVVGYGTYYDGTEYYIVKNSWSSDWGDKGYVLMARNKDNNCGIASAASYPV